MIRELKFSITMSDTEMRRWTSSRPLGVRTFTEIPSLLALVLANWPVGLGPEGKV